MNEPRRWLDEPRNVTRLVRGLYLLCALLFLADFSYEKHAHFTFEHWVGFYAIFGFVGYCFIVNAGKLLRRLVGRHESYYEGNGPRGDHQDD